MSAWKPLERREFRGIWLSTLAVHLFNWMLQVGAASLMTTLTPSPTMAALVQTAVSLPAVLFGLAAGAMADLVERRRWLIFTQLWLLTGVTMAFAVIVLGTIGPWSLLALTGLIGTAFALQMPASQAVIGEVVPREELPAALALSGVSFNISRVAGPALAGALAAAAGDAAVYAAVAIGSLGVLAFLVRWKGGVQRTRSAPTERLWGALRSGVRYVRQAPACRAQLAHTLVFMFCGSAAWALLPVLARDVHGLSSSGYGLLLGAFGVGGVLGILVMPPLRQRSLPHHVVAGSSLTFAAVTAVLGVSSLPLALVALVAGGIAWMCGITSIFAALQASLPDWVRARGLSIFNLAYFIAMGAGAALWGGLAGAVGTPAALVVAAAAMAFASLWQRARPLEPYPQC